MCTATITGRVYHDRDQSGSFAINPSSPTSDIAKQGWTVTLQKQTGALLSKLYKAFTEKDMSLLEVNPLVVTKDGKLICLDAKIGFDDNALYRHADILALRDGIGRVDALLRSFGEFAAPEHVPPDLAAAARRAIQLFAYDVRRATVQIEQRGPQVLMVDSDSSSLGDLVAHAVIASIEFARDGGRVEVILEKRGPAAVMELRADGGLGNREQALPYLDAARRLAPEAACDLSIETPAAGGARLSLSFPHPR